MNKFGFLLTVLSSALFSTAIAQTTDPDSISKAIELEEVVITSQHGEQRLLDIPASITAISA